MKHILFVVTSTSIIGHKKIQTGYEFSEVAVPYLALTHAGIAVDFASIAGGQPPAYGYEAHEINVRFGESAGFRRLNFSHRLDAVDFDAYDGVFFPGGLGPLVDMVTNEHVKGIVLSFHHQHKIIAAVCHGPAALLNITLENGQYFLKGKMTTCFTTDEETLEDNTVGATIPFFLEEEMIRQGAIIRKSSPFQENVIVDGNLITGQNPASANGVAIEIIGRLQR